ncbi:MAG TPA: glycoside hydrolase family 9 protein, partial [Clostridia bacterium]|nr:glycoside hydrolase family 9 protein [Clostridia bacterium]
MRKTLSICLSSLMLLGAAAHSSRAADINISDVDYAWPEPPAVGATTVHVLSPYLLELKLISGKEANPARVSQWDWVDDSGNYTGPSVGSFNVTVDGQQVPVTTLGFKRRPLFAPIAYRDLRVENSLYLQLTSPMADGQHVEVINPDGTVWSADTKFTATIDPLRYSPVIHVNQEGYVPNLSKKAMVGYYLGNLGELKIEGFNNFTIVDAVTGNQVYQGTLKHRADVGYSYTPAPYTQVYEADFTAFQTPGEYRLVVPGLGASLPFMIDEGTAMAFARAYALGLYHQRCGTATTLPYTRFTHDKCHAAPASVPTSADAFPFTWKTIANYTQEHNADAPPQAAPALSSPQTALFPFITQGTIDVSGGHHDAGDYSKYTVNSASLVHYLMFAADSLAGVAALDNLGIPESGDGISDVMQEAKWEADFLAKMQDQDGGFYFLVYPKDREYENNVTPDRGDPQVVWPKTTSVTAAAVAALAQMGSSPLFKQAYPAESALYLQKAKLGWQFLMNAINKYGKDGVYQKITHYGDNYVDRDELAWAACEIFLATGDANAHNLLLSWFDPADPATRRWSWWRMSEGFGHAIRSYAFAAQSGRIQASSLDQAYLAKCKAEILAAGDDMLKWNQQSAYGTSFPEPTKAVRGAGWYFSTDQAFDIAVAYQMDPKPTYLTA